MASSVAQILFMAFSVAFSALRSLESFLAVSSKASPSTSLGPGAQLVAGALLFAILITFELTCLLLFAYVRGLGAGGAAHGGFLAIATRRFATTTLAAAAVAALLAGAVLPRVSTGAGGLE